MRRQQCTWKCTKGSSAHKIAKHTTVHRAAHSRAHRIAQQQCTSSLSPLTLHSALIATQRLKIKPFIRCTHCINYANFSAEFKICQTRCTSFFKISSINPLKDYPKYCYQVKTAFDSLKHLPLCTTYARRRNLSQNLLQPPQSRLTVIRKINRVADQKKSDKCDTDMRNMIT